MDSDKQAKLHTMMSITHLPLYLACRLCALAAPLLVGVALVACTGNGRVQPSLQPTDHPTLTPQEGWEMSDRRLMPGSYAPLLRLPFLFAQDADASRQLDSIGHHAHILLFWASWCSDCREETPALVALQKEFPQLPWLTVSLDNEACKARQYIHAHALGGIHLFDGRDWRGSACDDYAVALHGIPYMVLVDQNGKLSWTGQQADSLRLAILREFPLPASPKGKK